MCGIVAVANKERPAVEDCITGCNALQHRGRETAGIATQSGDKTFFHLGPGKVEQVFLPFYYNWRELLPGTIGIGHTRYSTSSQSDLENAQPVRGFFRGIPFYLAHNGNVVNITELRSLAGCNTEDTISDTRLVAQCICQSDAPTFEAALLEILPLLRGAFCFVALYKNKIYAVRDRFGFHPLQIARRHEGWMVASESCVFFHLGADFVREIDPGELVILDGDGFEIKRWINSPGLKFDIFEFIYFLRPDSMVYGVRVREARRRMGWYLAREHPLAADLVIAIPDSGNAAAFGCYTGLRDLGMRVSFDPEALFRPHAKRTFIGPDEKERWESIRLKFTVIPESLLGVKCLVVADDSIVRGKTRKRTTQLLREGAASVGNTGLQVLALNSSPPYRWPDFYGIDTYRGKDELIVARFGGDLEAARKEMNLDYLGYLSLESTIQAILDVAPSQSPLTKESFYTGPFTGEYPDGTGDFEI